MKLENLEYYNVTKIDTIKEMLDLAVKEAGEKIAFEYRNSKKIYSNEPNQETPTPTEYYLETLANYIVFCMEKEEKRQKKIMTENRAATISKREISYEGLGERLESGEDGIYNLTNESKQIIFQPKVTITQHDLETIPTLKNVRDAITIFEEKAKTAEGREAYVLRNAIIELRKDQYIIKNAYLKPIKPKKITHSIPVLHYPESFSFTADGYVKPEGASLCDPKVCAAILANYSRLKLSYANHLDKEIYYLMLSFDELIEIALKDEPVYRQILDMKIDGYQNTEIQDALSRDQDVDHSLEYISSLWKKKIPSLIASAAEDQLLD